MPLLCRSVIDDAVQGIAVKGVVAYGRDGLGEQVGGKAALLICAVGNACDPLGKREGGDKYSKVEYSLPQNGHIKIIAFHFTEEETEAHLISALELHSFLFSSNLENSKYVAVPFRSLQVSHNI